MAHRPENTIEAFAHARRLGIGGVETDAWLTADGVAVLHHDGVVRAGRQRQRIGTLRRSDLPAAIPSITELYQVCGADLDIAVDVLDPGAAPALVAAAASAGAGAPAKLWLCGTSVDQLAEWRHLHPAVHLVHSDDDWKRHRGDPVSHLRLLRDAGVEVLNLHWRQCTPALSRECHAQRLRLFAWGIRWVHTMRRLRSTGVDGLMSDHVDRLLAAVR